MPDLMDQKLEELLAYPAEKAGETDLFVVDVMRHVAKQRRTRKLILFLFGGIGAIFGLIGALLLSDSISQLLTETVSAVAWLQIPLFTAGAIAFYAWFMNDDLHVSH